MNYDYEPTYEELMELEEDASRPIPRNVVSDRLIDACADIYEEGDEDREDLDPWLLKWSDR